MKKNGSLPEHIAIIMDGNGRWARQKKLLRIKGHETGAKAVREITRECAKKHIKQLTLYAFSQENWKRPKREIDLLMKLLKNFLIGEREEIQKNNIRLTAIGRIKELPEFVQRELSVSIEESKMNTGMVLCLALNYGGRTEIIDATKKIVAELKKGKLKIDEITEESFKKYLYMPNMPDPDLLIRTGGEMRISNFLLWEISYAELWVTDTYWPDFKKPHLEEALLAYANRERRYGGLKE
ncbi:MAG: isoprenyl transferase [Candidatus Kuenenia stuttgartiensis]|jgi:undecaprenyl diphosphate synthase|uniref:Isoprenyl transferase n=1 Tax=Kuenenia stuttgartiensis TaxID=174633 RepID=A0A2C9CDP2_KUEST|nr:MULTISPECIES: isoprenyl transferase [Kuenenia]MBZ0191528.1 isoprenyl transferase [Candidatus Kuenenia stuttgartiensis]MCL4727558.1 isoprenyl transferase [Candidatus Kuenenia stuttgartiensis]MCZ7624342.1 isoprenyl transferase [Candidatus Kuenenia sp.]TVM01437.1 MAG: isoprenyl transferase [Candidatus Kuenenia stuttgartiensis]SOH03708.1 strongly similar to undecaprenyl diphosphate synthase [Candidatus Kuenenia stuttgartiensis]